MALLMGQKASLWWDLPAMDSFLLLKDIYQIETNAFYQRIQMLAKRLDIEKQLTVQIRRLSLGERMKVELIGALLHNPQVIFLDEPTIGLDFTAQKAIRNFIKEYRQEFKPIIVLTSHYMEDIEDLCQHLIILREGKIVYDGDLTAIKQQLSPEKDVHLLFRKKLSVENREQLCHITTPAQEINYPDQSCEYIFQLPMVQISSLISKANTLPTLKDIQITSPPVSTLIEKIQREGVL
jgi:ABC-2 type transport system ATP-binding protein